MKMNKKIIVTLISICFLTMGAGSAFAVSLNKEVVTSAQKLIKSDVADENTTIIDFQAYGPVREITEIELISGPDAKIQKINKMMSRRFFYPLVPVVYVKNLTFNITFTEQVKNRSKNWYATAYSKIDINITKDNRSNITIIINKPHSYTVKNFTGVFVFIKPKIFRFFSFGQKFFRPYRFAIIGVCENITSHIVIT